MKEGELDFFRYLAGRGQGGGKMEGHDTIALFVFGANNALKKGRTE